MKNFVAALAVFLCICCFAFSNISCKISATQPHMYPGTHEIAPEKTLPVREIMHLQGITSIHFAIFDSSIVNGHYYYPPAGYSEYYIDTSRIKIIKLKPESPFRNIAVYDVNKGIAWKSTDGKVENLSLGMNYIALFYGTEAQAVLANGLEGPVRFTGQGYMEDKLCDIFEDTSGVQEWVWVKHRLPVQYIHSWSYDNIGGTEFTKMRNIEINEEFQDEIFAPPQ